MKWYETWDYKTRRNYWWTQRDENGVCYEVKKKDNGLFSLYQGEHEKFLSSHNTLQDAMDAAK